MAKQNIIDIVKEMLADFLAENGYELWNAEFVKEGKDFSLRVFIDRTDDGGIGTDDCEKVSKYLSGRLDEADPIDTNYYLVVSSPGMDRPLLTEAHFQRYAGAAVDVSLYKAFEGSKKHSGILCVRTETHLIITPEQGAQAGRPLQIPLEWVSKVRLQVIF